RILPAVTRAALCLRRQTPPAKRQMTHGLLQACRTNRDQCTVRGDKEIRADDPLEYLCRQSRPKAANEHLPAYVQREVARLHVNPRPEGIGHAKSAADAAPEQKKRFPLRVEQSAALDFL